MEYKYTGIVLGKKDIGEADRLYTFYTLEQGKIKAIARGVRKSQAKLAGHLENFCLVDFTVMKNRGMGNIASSVVEDNFLGIRRDFDILNSVFSVLGIFDKMIQEDERDRTLFLLLLNYFSVLNENCQNYEIINQAFLFKFFEFLGYGISTGFCVSCKKAIGKENNYFDYQSGGVSCKDCAKNVSNKTAISSNVIKLIRIFSSNRFESLNKLKVSRKDVADLELLSGNFIKWIS